ncbi:MAG: CHAT domain-containing protein, partial [Cyanobacteria bacterium P01_D01_bin.56]
LTLLEDTSNSLDRALLQNNLSLAHQQLGQWDKAETAISASIRLLENLEASLDSAAYLETFAKALNTQGRLNWVKGNMDAALDNWQQATAAYQQARHEQGVLLSLINQAKALQAQGLYFQAKTILEQDILRVLENEQLDARLRAVGWWHLGNAHRQFGLLKESQDDLKNSLDIINGSPLLANLQDSVLLDLGNTKRAQGNRALAIGKIAQANKQWDTALGFYQEAAITTHTPITRLQANLNRLSLLIETERFSEAKTLWSTLMPEVSNLPASRTTIHAQLNFSKSLLQLIQVDNEQKSTSISKNLDTAPDWVNIELLLNRAMQQAQELNDEIAESYAVGQLGELYEITHQWSQAQQFTQQALQLTEAHQILDGRYRWEWQMGRLLKQQGKQKDAINAYSAAVETLKLVRNDLLFINADVQFSFRDNVEPIYRELVELLVNTPNPSQKNLEQAIQQIDSLQLSELENFLRCDLTQTTAISQLTSDPKTAILYPIILEERIAVILQLPGEKKITQTLVEKSDVDASLKQLRRMLSNPGNPTSKIKTTSQQVYRWLIEPFEADLQHSQIETLVFVLDGPLRNIPMAVLFDGEQFLIEKYGVAIAPQLDLFTPSPLAQEPKVFVGGIGQPQTFTGDTFSEPRELTFPEIENIVTELEGISQSVNTSSPLLEEKFTVDNLKQQLTGEDYSVIHLKTHGVFSSDPEETFIVAHEELIKGRDLGDLIQIGGGETPIELLILSACSTAKGDNRAVLGLAGIAVRAGARSAISTLWDAQDIPNTRLMVQFYQELAKDNTTRAQALRTAQLALLESGYRNPNIWANYVLVGNWL